ncbi:MAG: hypothetical protein ABII90_01915 [Bacteroidota bacterium]
MIRHFLHIISIIFLFIFCIGSAYGGGAPSNDDPCNAEPLTVGASCTFSSYSNANATDSGEPDPLCASYAGGDVWFSVTVPASGNLIFDSNTGVVTDGGMAIYSGTCNSLTLIECDDDDSPNGLMPMISGTGLTPGATIWIRFWEYGNDNTGTFDICVYDIGPCSDCSNADVIGSIPFSQSGLSTCGACDNFSTADVCSDNYISGDDYVFTYTPSTNDTVNISLASTDSYTGLFVFDDCPTVMNANCISSATSSNGNESLLGVILSSGTTYYIIVSSWPLPQCVDFDISLTQGSGSGQPNQYCSTAIELCGPQTVVGSTNGALNEPSIGPPESQWSCNSVYDNYVYYTFNTGSGGMNSVTIDVTTPGCGVDPLQVAVFESPPTPCQSSADWGASLYCEENASPFTINTSLAGSTTYYIVFDNWPGDFCNFTFDISGNDPCFDCATTPITTTVTASPSTICAGSSSNLSASPSGGASPYTYSWSPATGLSSTTVSNPVATPPSTTTYQVTITDDNGCTDNTSVTVNVSDLYVLVNASPTSICNGDTTDLSITTSSGTPPYTYSWSPAASLSNANIADPMAWPSTTTTYTATITDNAGCIIVGSVTITVTPGLSSDFTLSPSPVCECDTVTITYTGTGAPTDIYIWDFAGGTVVSGSGQGPYEVFWPDCNPAIVNITLSVTNGP